MPLEPGTRLGPYEIVSPLGAGGMGEVYRALDPRLNRTVAIKVSKERFSERFEREARAVAALNHPNICQLYDVGPDYLVMEYVDGAPLTAVDSTRKLLELAVQIADGLAAAHAAGIVHRDLKPDNILVARDGRLRILDFGLAKTALAESAPDDPTRAIAITQAGTTMGTIAYMSPEQARGVTDLTPQSDQFSFGLILYELVAGKRAFQRESGAETMVAIIREDAEPLPISVPAPLRWIIERLLAKERTDRYDSTRDLYRELRQLRDRLTETTSPSGIQPAVADAAPATPKPAVRTNRRLILACAIAGILAAIIAWLARPVADLSRTQLTPMEVSEENPSTAYWSPDGKAFTYVAGSDGARRVYLRYLNSPTAAALTPPGNWSVAGWSSDGKRIVGAIASGSDEQDKALNYIPTFGGDPQPITKIDNVRAGAVSPDGKILAVLRRENGVTGLYTASPINAPLKRYSPAPFETGDSIINSPEIAFSRDSRWITLVLDIPGGRQAWLIPYPAGQGAPRRILQNLSAEGGTPELSFFPDDRSGVLSFDRNDTRHLWIAGLRSGSRRQLTSGVSSESRPSISPDGKKLLFLESHADYMILSASLADAEVERLISSERAAGMPVWARRQNAFAYVGDRSGTPAIWMRSNGADRPIITIDAFPAGTTDYLMTPALSPAADRLVFTRVGSDKHVAIWISSLAGGSPVRLTNTPDKVEVGGDWSPDGSTIVYSQVTNGTGNLMIVKTSGEATPKTLRANIVPELPTWSLDGQWVLFLQSNESGWALISPDGKTERPLGEPKAVQMTFSADSKLLYGIRVDKDRRELFSLDPATKQEKVIGEISRDFTPDTFLNPGIRLSLSPDGKSVLYPALRSSTSLWMMEGFDGPHWTERLREILPW